jgi:3'(2'), 5'-bisphosphate nucleotidase
VVGGRRETEIGAGPDLRRSTKGDASPVTEADERAEAIILAGLAELTPAIPVIAEEQPAAQGLSE